MERRGLAIKKKHPTPTRGKPPRRAWPALTHLQERRSLLILVHLRGQALELGGHVAHAYKDLVLAGLLGTATQCALQLLQLRQQVGILIRQLLQVLGMGKCSQISSRNIAKFPLGAGQPCLPSRAAVGSWANTETLCNSPWYAEKLCQLCKGLTPSRWTQNTKSPGGGGHHGSRSPSPHVPQAPQRSEQTTLPAH